MFEEYKTYRYIIPGWLFIFYTFLFILPFLNLTALNILKELNVIVAIGALGLPLGFVIYQVWLPIEMHLEYCKREEFLGNNYLKCYNQGRFFSSAKIAYQELKKKNNKNKEEDNFFFEREYVRHLISSSENKESVRNLRNLWSCHDSRKYNGLYIPISAMIISIIGICILGSLNAVIWHSNLMNIPQLGFNIQWILEVVIVIEVAIVSIAIWLGSKRVWKQIHCLELCLLMDILYKRGENVNERNYLIGYLDILGFKDLVEKESLECVYNSVCRVLKDLKKTLQTGEDSPSFKVYGHLKIPPYAKQILENQTANAGWFYFSDTWIFFIDVSNSSQEENIEKFKELCLIMNLFIVKSILTPKKGEDVKSIAFRGAISYGPCIIKKTDSIFLGQPIIDAYKLAESQMWMGEQHILLFQRIG